MLRVIPRIAKESRHILIRPNKREIEPKESGMNQGFWQLHMAMWQSQVDSSNTVCLPLCYFTYLPNRHVFIFLPLQKEDCHCLEEEKKKNSSQAQWQNIYRKHLPSPNFSSRALHSVSKHSQEARLTFYTWLTQRATLASECVCPCVRACTQPRVCLPDVVVQPKQRFRLAYV